MGGTKQEYVSSNRYRILKQKLSIVIIEIYDRRMRQEEAN